MGNYTTNFFRNPDTKRLPTDKAFVSYNRDGDDQSFSISCQHTPSTGSEATLGDEWFNYEMLEYYIPTPCKSKLNRGTKRARIRAKQINVVSSPANVVDPDSSMHDGTKINMAVKSASASAVLISSPSVKRAPEKNTVLFKSAAQSNMVTSRQPRQTAPTKQSSTDVLNVFPSTSSEDTTSKETALDTTLFVSQDVTLEPIDRFQTMLVRLSSSAPAPTVSKSSVEASFETPESTYVTPDAKLTGSIHTDNKAKSSGYAIEGISTKETVPESSVSNRSSLTQIKTKRVTEGCIGRRATQLLATFKSCIGIESNGVVAYSVSYILKSPSSHEKLIQPT